MDDLDEHTYAIIQANTAANKRLESFYAPDPPKQAVMSLATVVSQRAQIEILVSKMRQRAWRPISVAEDTI